jgi:hypothetical protein
MDLLGLSYFFTGKTNFLLQKQKEKGELAVFRLLSSISLVYSVLLSALTAYSLCILTLGMLTIGKLPK